MSEKDFNLLFSKNLNHYLNINDKTQLDLAKYLGASASAVSAWCRGVKTPRMDKVDAMCEYFGIKRSDLMEDKSDQENDQYYLNDETRQIAQEVFENPELRTLFSVARDIAPERLKAHIDFMQNLKDQEKGNNDEGC